jgi:hypothetical protein
MYRFFGVVSGGVLVLQIFLFVFENEALISYVFGMPKVLIIFISHDLII